MTKRKAAAVVPICCETSATAFWLRKSNLKGFESYRCFFRQAMQRRGQSRYESVAVSSRALWEISTGLHFCLVLIAGPIF